jgi:hypothetical protein
MVKKIITITIILLLMTYYSVAKAQKKNPTVEELFGAYQVISLAKIDWCYSGITKESAKEEIGKKIILSKKYASNLWREVHHPLYGITRQTPSAEEGEVYPEYLQRLFEMNGDFDDELILLTVSYPSDNRACETLEIVDNNTLLFEDGCWVYTLKRIK